ncbi:hypothetical protein PCANC_25235 [Puccinia coronata f. sp. avenae]|uniref:Uncharacterized protein n=1 Tax=Puccinia coronata f. sp. avenae TaxID=200324 RepID=A0A2N5TPG9_9BASI|nr:hypothetical protein PCANC_25235 [Puccinia coronata f. sp. avenae]
MLKKVKTIFSPLQPGLSPSQITPTIGQNIRRITLSSIYLKFWDLGGLKDIRRIWENQCDWKPEEKSCSTPDQSSSRSSASFWHGHSRSDGGNHFVRLLTTLEWPGRKPSAPISNSLKAIKDKVPDVHQLLVDCPAMLPTHTLSPKAQRCLYSYPSIHVPPVHCAVQHEPNKHHPRLPIIGWTNQGSLQIGQQILSHSHPLSIPRDSSMSSEPHPRITRNRRNFSPGFIPFPTSESASFSIQTANRIIRHPKFSFASGHLSAFGFSSLHCHTSIH